MIDKNKAMLDYLRGCPALADLFFLFGDGKNGDTGFTAKSNDYVQMEFVDGSAFRWYDFTLIHFAAANTFVNDTVNLDSLHELEEAVTEWLNEQDEKGSYPDFGDRCRIDSIYTVPNSTTVAGRDYTGMKIMITCRVEYYEERK